MKRIFIPAFATLIGAIVTSSANNIVIKGSDTASCR
jgi:hypothetical protein